MYPYDFVRTLGSYEMGRHKQCIIIIILSQLLCPQRNSTRPGKLEQRLRHNQQEKQTRTIVMSTFTANDSNNRHRKSYTMNWLIRCGDEGDLSRNVVHKNSRHCTNGPCSHSYRLQSIHSNKQLHRCNNDYYCYSFPNTPPFYPSLVGPASSPPAAASCVSLPDACWLVSEWTLE